jgi:hypothetical protein
MSAIGTKQTFLGQRSMSAIGGKADMVLMAFLIGVVWWVVGRIMRWGFYKTWGHT